MKGKTKRLSRMKGMKIVRMDQRQADHLWIRKMGGEKNCKIGVVRGTQSGFGRKGHG